DREPASRLSQPRCSTPHRRPDLVARAGRLGQRLGRPTAILVVSAHWESAPLTIGATRTVPLVYDFYGFPKRYYEITYPSPGAPELAAVAVHVPRRSERDDLGKDRAGVLRAGPQGWLRVGQKRLQRGTRSSTTCPIVASLDLRVASIRGDVTRGADTAL